MSDYIKENHDKWFDMNHQKWIDDNNGLPFYIWIEKANGLYKVMECKDYPTASRLYRKLLPKENPAIHTTYVVMNYRDTMNRLNRKQLEENIRRPECQWV
jgi:hypothetical protein